MKFSKIY